MSFWAGIWLTRPFVDDVTDVGVGRPVQPVAIGEVRSAEGLVAFAVKAVAGAAKGRELLLAGRREGCVVVLAGIRRSVVLVLFMILRRPNAADVGNDLGHARVAERCAETPASRRCGHW